MYNKKFSKFVNKEYEEKQRKGHMVITFISSKVYMITLTRVT